MPQIRRKLLETPEANPDTSQSIIESALAVMAEDGIANLTTKSVSKRAAVSTGSIHYFFDTKDNLIYAAFEHMVRLIREETLLIRRQEADPLARIARSILVHFSPFHFEEGASIIWPQFWVYAGADEQAARLFRAFSKRMISNHTWDLQEAGYDRQSARHKAVELSVLSRGLWLEKRLARSVKTDECWRIMENALAEAAIKTGLNAPKFSDVPESGSDQ